ncbi:MAG TPA: zinc-binding dehydrogenase [Gaiellaceae bacterium]
MRALRWYGPGDVRVDEVPEPVPGPGEVLVQVEVALTDGTDLKAFRHGHPVLLAEPPAPFGHEFAGIDVATGQRVAGVNSVPCGSCAACDRNEEAQCERRTLLNGAYAELIAAPERNLLPVASGLALEVAAMVEPLACCLHGVERAAVGAGDTVAVLGAGPIGLMLCACATDAGANVVLVGGRPERRALATDFGATSGDGAGVDVVIEATGTEDGWRYAVALARRGGTVVLFGGLPGGTQVALDATRIHYDELTLRGAFHHTPRTVRAALAFLASGARPWEKLLTHEVGLDGIAPLFADPPREYLKAVVRPQKV